MGGANKFIIAELDRNFARNSQSNIVNNVLSKILKNNCFFRTVGIIIITCRPFAKSYGKAVGVRFSTDNVNLSVN